jgi:hypothetical protein
MSESAKAAEPLDISWGMQLLFITREQVAHEQLLAMPVESEWIH